MGQYLKGNNMAQIKIHNGGYYTHAQTILFILFISLFKVGLQ